VSGDLVIRPSVISGELTVPGSKSHTLRALVFSALAEGVSTLRNPLISGDTVSCRRALEMLGASFQEEHDHLKVSGTGGKLKNPGSVIQVGNSGTTLRILTAVSALAGHPVTLDGDDSLRSRPMRPLLAALRDLGASAQSRDGHAPITVSGPIGGGKTTVEGVTSQFVTALLTAAPLASGDTEIEVDELNERPYVAMTLNWLDTLKIQYDNREYRNFRIPGRQAYPPFHVRIPGDFSTAAFPLTAAAVTGGKVSLNGLNLNDLQGDKRVLNILRQMGASIAYSDIGIIAEGGPLKGFTVELKDIPDSLPSLAVAGCAAEGETRLVNVPQARLKESDRITAMCGELKKLGADIHELPDGLVIRKSRLTGNEVECYGDHRIAMALSIAGMIAAGETVIKNGAAAPEITYPSFVSDFQKLGADISFRN